MASQELKSEVANFFKEYMNHLRTETGQLVHTMRADNGGEFTGHIFRAWLSTNSIRLETSASHTPEQNGVSERANRTIMEGARCLIHAKDVHLELWGEAIAFTVYTLNRVSTKTAPFTAYKNWFGTKPDIYNLRIFGSVARPYAQSRKEETGFQKYLLSPCWIMHYPKSLSFLGPNRKENENQQRCHL
jgi:hypothetical protein